MDPKTERKYLFLILVVFVAACIETDIFLPALPDMMARFSVSEGVIQNLLTWNFVGICLSGPFYGPFADAMGRKRPLIVALGLFLSGSLMTLFASSFDWMLWGRVLQGLGSGGCFTLGTAIIFDAFQKEKAIAAVTKLNTVMPLIMAGAPMLGGYLNYSFGFRSNFLAIAAFVLVSLFISLFYFEETLPKEKRTPLQWDFVLRDFKQVFKSLAFWQLTGVMSIIFGAYIAFLSGTAVLFVVEFGMSKQVFPLIQAAVLGGWVSGSLTLNSFLKKWGGDKVKKMGILLSALGGAGLGLAAWMAPRDPYFLTSAMVLYAFGANWIMGLYFPEGMEILPNSKGVTASLLTSARLLISALVVGLTSFLYDATIYPMAAVIVGSVVFFVPTLIFYEKAKVRLISSV